MDKVRCSCGGMLYADEDGLICLTCGTYDDYFLPDSLVQSVSPGRRVTYGEIRDAAREILIGTPARVIAARMGLGVDEFRILLKHSADKTDEDRERAYHQKWYTNRGGRTHGGIFI